ncbi:NPCBM/NEW2 domain-containing protein [Botrimarina sp.]|uniref:NPCBM/NEW2 domain-containing protein n=1 Tax=Botrimarina sp. TaxID=2795802 RepID=UPI0032EE7DDF
MTRAAPFITAGALWLSGALASAAVGAEAVLADGRSLADAQLTGCRFDATARTATLEADGQTHQTDRLVRFGEPAAPSRRPAIVLGDGSLLLADRGWSPTGLVQIRDDTVGVRRGSGWVSAPRSAVRWVAPDLSAIDRVEGEEFPEDSDLVLLASGDRVAGRVVALTAETANVEVAGEAIQVPLEEVAAVRLGGPREASPASGLIGYGDGSLVRASAIAIDGDKATATTPDGVQIESDAASVVFVQPLGGPVRYLSDTEPVDYRHTPYLDLAWPYARDEGLLGGPLEGGGRRAAKGLAMHSAARLVYKLGPEAQRFRCDVAVADPPPESSAEGSVVFRVYLVREGAFALAYDSGVVRAGDAALPVDVDLTGAAALALVVDYADNGDAGDEALWLDARLVMAE